MLHSQIVAIVSCLFVVVSTLCLIFSTLPSFEQNDGNISRKEAEKILFEKNFNALFPAQMNNTSLKSQKPSLSVGSLLSTSSDS